MITILTAALSGLIGYFLGRAKTFFEAKQQVYEQVATIILKASYDLQIADKKGLNEAMAKTWLYGNRNVALKMNRVMAIMIDQTRGDLTQALQEVVVEMRNDIQPFPFLRKIEPSEVTHLYTQVKQAGIDDSPKKGEG